MPKGDPQPGDEQTSRQETHLRRAMCGMKKVHSEVHSWYIRGTFGYIRTFSGTFGKIGYTPTHKNQHFRKVLQIWQVHSPHAPQPFIILKGEIAQDALITSWDASRLLEFYARFCSWFLSAGFFLFPSPTLPSPPFRPTLPPALATRRCAWRSHLPHPPSPTAPPPPMLRTQTLSRLPHFP